ncbi:putative quinol oxidase aa3-600 chain IV [Fictibacillus macauensis ZFHKF-1]|uniref:Quinol oxidase subunit 4 n=1 Tax=Fictibacillus macauensis ZFHKF-1 TaxID=1196324 RepID=I8AMV5_9BACL|nr:putative quinol oxidase aa3-600 chain IV [Fictibacillus macauensis ZFHKF-1]
MANHNNAAAHGHGGIPWKHVVGYIFSIILTLLALYVTYKTDFSRTTIITIIFIFGFLQAAIQLLMFMHMTESSQKNSKLSGNTQTGNMLFAAFVAVVIVAGTVWVMGAGHAEHDHHNMKSEHKMEMNKDEMDHSKMDHSEHDGMKMDK